MPAICRLPLAIVGFTFTILLSVLGARSEAPLGRLDIAKVGNSDPGALDKGIVFHSSVPISERKLLVDDLVWLYSLGDLKGGGELSRLARMTRSNQLSGADIVEWLLD